MGTDIRWPAYIMHLEGCTDACWDPCCLCVWLEKRFKKEDEVMLQQAMLHICTVQLVAEPVHIPA